MTGWEHSGPIGKCRSCGKHCFPTRKAAKKYMTDRFPNQSMSVYRCEDEPEFFHFGHTPYSVRKGFGERGKTPPSRRQ